jgi:hypothetical protein
MLYEAVTTCNPNLEAVTVETPASFCMRSIASLFSLKLLFFTASTRTYATCAAIGAPATKQRLKTPVSQQKLLLVVVEYVLGL